MMVRLLCVANTAWVCFSEDSTNILQVGEVEHGASLDHDFVCGVNCHDPTKSP